MFDDRFMEGCHEDMNITEYGFCYAIGQAGRHLEGFQQIIVVNGNIN